MLLGAAYSKILPNSCSVRRFVHRLRGAFVRPADVAGRAPYGVPRLPLWLGALGGLNRRLASDSHLILQHARLPP
jgi:hypothetical protein